VALANNARAPRISYPPLEVVRFGGPALTEGVQTHNLEGIDVQITTVCWMPGDIGSVYLQLL